MKRFRDGQKVRVIASVFLELNNRVGVVVRRRMGDNGAWVAIRGELPERCRVFAPDDSRANQVLLFPEECEEVKA